MGPTPTCKCSRSCIVVATYIAQLARLAQVDALDIPRGNPAARYGPTWIIYPFAQSSCDGSASATCESLLRLTSLFALPIPLGSTVQSIISSTGGALHFPTAGWLLPICSRPFPRHRDSIVH
eukprot:6076037-Pyramimonas_sp.AAC.1